ncbi:MAG: hypothetical protein GKR95_06215 [Gammaproteobacteria bacterium]|nr:hypothetical protein [Gammaproteobacteria bacterium]
MLLNSVIWNRYRVTGLLILTIILSSLVGCSSGGGSSSGGGGATSASKILVIGDSIGTGYGLAVPYPVRIQQSTGATLINDSADGRVTSEVLHG